VAGQHREVRVLREPVHGPKLVQRFSHELGEGERAAPDGYDDCMWHAGTLGRDDRAEVHLVADEHIRAPRLAELEDRGAPRARGPPGEAFTYRAELSFPVELEQRCPLAAHEQRRAARVEAAEPGALDNPDHSGLTRERNSMARLPGRTGEWHERQEMAGSAGKGEEDPQLGLRSPE
jgi:hypothetical protein